MSYQEFMTLYLIITAMFCFFMWVTTRPYTVGISCWRCNESGIDEYQKEFECEDCKGTGVIVINECYIPYFSNPVFNIVWMKRIWFKRKVIK